MADHSEEWQRVGAAVGDRIEEMGVTWAEFHRLTGISFKTIKSYIGGAPIVRTDKRRELCGGLDWTPDSIDRLLAGQPAMRRGDATDSPDSVDVFVQQFHELAVMLKELTPQEGAAMMREHGDTIRDLLSAGQQVHERLGELIARYDSLAASNEQFSSAANDGTVTPLPKTTKTPRGGSRTDH